MTHAYARYSAPAVRRMWLEGVPQVDIAARFGATASAVSKWVKSMGLPPRQGGVRSAGSEAEALAMYAFGLNVRVIARAAGMSPTTVIAVVRRRGIEPRGSGYMANKARPTLQDYRAAQLAEAMAREAAVTQAAMRDAEMIDGLRRQAA